MQAIPSIAGSFAEHGASLIHKSDKRPRKTVAGRLSQLSFPGGDQAMADESKLNVFMSYSRHDLAFADQLYAALGAFDFELSIDRHSIPGGDEWEEPRRSGPRGRNGRFHAVSVIGSFQVLQVGG